MAGPYFFGSEGWKLVPGHFAERHGLIIIIALGESIVAIGVGASGALDLGIGTAAVLGVFLAAALWWTYFDVVALVSARRLGEAEAGRVQNELARDSYSYIHLLMVAGIVLVAFGMKVTIGHHDEHLHDVPAFALLGGLAIYLLGLVAFRYRHVQTLNRQRLGLAIVLLFLVPVATAMPALISLAVAVVLIWAMIAYEHRGYGPGRDAAPPRSKRGPHLGILPEPFEHSRPPRQAAARRRALRIRGTGRRGLARGRLLRRGQRRRDRLDDRPRRRGLAAARRGRPHRRDRPRSSPTSTRRASSGSPRSAAGTRRSSSASGSRSAARTASSPASSAASRSTCSRPTSARRSSS